MVKLLFGLAIDTATGDIRPEELTSGDKGGSPVLPDLLDQIPTKEQLDTRRRDAAIL